MRNNTLISNDAFDLRSVTPKPKWNRRQDGAVGWM